MTLSGKTPSLFRHDLIGLHANSKQSHRFTISVNAMTKIPEKFVPKKYSMTSKVPETKGTTKCCVGRNPYNGYKYLCGALPGGVFLMQWYDPLNKFMLLKHFECSIANPPRVFEMIITPDLEYPIGKQIMFYLFSKFLFSLFSLCEREKGLRWKIFETGYDQPQLEQFLVSQ